MDYSNMPLEEKRSFYRCGDDYVTLDQVLPWPDYVKERPCSFTRRGTVLLMLFCTITVVPIEAFRKMLTNSFPNLKEHL
jgi:hypothetical protein